MVKTQRISRILSRAFLERQDPSSAEPSPPSFLKDPLFFADSLFLKKPERIIALRMIMGMALLIYILVERQLRLLLAKNNATIPDQ